MLVYDRKAKDLFEVKEYQKELLSFLYTTFPGRILLKLFAARPWFSQLKSLYQKSYRSKKDIEPFIKEHNVEISGYDLTSFNSFNDFFIRQRSYNTNSKENELIAIADSKLSVYKIDADLKFKIKNSVYNISEIVCDDNISKLFENGYALIFRLDVSDYHRYVFIDDGELIYSKFIKGELHTVRPVSKKYKVYSRNSRMINILKTRHFGIIAQAEIGALLVGKIINYPVKEFSKLDEKGYFEFGGSTIVMLLPSDIVLDDDIWNQSKAGYETQVYIGEKIGERMMEKCSLR